MKINIPLQEKVLFSAQKKKKPTSPAKRKFPRNHPLTTWPLHCQKTLALGATRNLPGSWQQLCQFYTSEPNFKGAPPNSSRRRWEAPSDQPPRPGARPCGRPPLPQPPAPPPRTRGPNDRPQPPARRPGARAAPARGSRFPWLPGLPHKNRVHREEPSPRLKIGYKGVGLMMAP